MENETPKPDPRDLEIQELKSQLKTLRDRHDYQERRADALDKKLKAKSPPGDFVQLGGVAYPVLLTVRADNTFAEVKRGHVFEGATMAVIDKQH